MAYIVVCTSYGRTVLRGPDLPFCPVPHWTKDEAQAIVYPAWTAAQVAADRMTRLMRGPVATVEELAAAETGG